MMIHKCPDDFKKTLKILSIRELIDAVKDLRTFPEDAEFLKAAQAELKRRATAKSPKQTGTL